MTEETFTCQEGPAEFILIENESVLAYIQGIFHWTGWTQKSRRVNHSPWALRLGLPHTSLLEGPEFLWRIVSDVDEEGVPDPEDLTGKTPIFFRADFGELGLGSSYRL